MKERPLESEVWIGSILLCMFIIPFFFSLAYMYFFQPVPTLVLFQVIFMYGKGFVFPPTM